MYAWLAGFAHNGVQTAQDREDEGDNISLEEEEDGAKQGATPVHNNHPTTMSSHPLESSTMPSEDQAEHNQRVRCINPLVCQSLAG